MKGEHETEKQKRFRRVRRTWIPITKNLLSTAADIVGDWVFYLRVAKGGYGRDLEPWLLFFSILSSILGAFTAISLVMHHWSFCVNIHSIHKTRFQNIVNVALLSEMFIEDIPQFVLTWIGKSILPFVNASHIVHGHHNFCLVLILNFISVWCTDSIR